jgi:hypothetical protein
MRAATRSASPVNRRALNSENMTHNVQPHVLMVEDEEAIRERLEMGILAPDQGFGNVARRPTSDLLSPRT